MCIYWGTIEQFLGVTRCHKTSCMRLQLPTEQHAAVKSGIASISNGFQKGWQVADTWCVFDEERKTYNNFLVFEQEITAVPCPYIGVHLVVSAIFKWLWMADFFNSSLFSYTQKYGTCRILRHRIELREGTRDAWLKRSLRLFYRLHSNIVSTCATLNMQVECSSESLVAI
jgi:alanine-alpha-ketoisovalerate/valine-pyruvate aminotransferase